jgi:hypothetical protein
MRELEPYRMAQKLGGEDVVKPIKMEKVGPFRTPAIHRVNNEVRKLNPFACFAFPVLTRHKKIPKYPSFGDELVTSFRHAKAHVTKERYIKAFDPAVLAAMKRMETTLDAMKPCAPTVRQIN